MSLAQPQPHQPRCNLRTAMSFGYGIGDFVLLTQLAWQVVQNSRKACGAHAELTYSATSLHRILRRLEVEVSKSDSILSQSDEGADRRGQLAQLLGTAIGFKNAVQDLGQVQYVIGQEEKCYKALKESQVR
jgi:hypothetical protein